MSTEKIVLTNLSDRLNYALELTGTRKIDLARAISVKPQSIQFLCSSKTLSSRFTFEIATALGLNTRWLATGEGEMFLADDPRQQLLKAYKSVPLLSNAQIRNIFLNQDPVNLEAVQEWFPLKTEDDDKFVIKVTDSSMEPVFPIESYVFVKKSDHKNALRHQFVLCYLKKFDTFIIRELMQKDTAIILVPKNSELFREINVTEDTHILGVVTGCFWHVRD